MDYPEPVLKDPLNKRLLPTAATVSDPDLSNHMAVFHTFNRNSIAKVLLPHTDMDAAEVVWSALGLWDGEKRYPSDTGELPCCPVPRLHPPGTLKLSTFCMLSPAHVFTELIHKAACDMPPSLLSEPGELEGKLNESLVLHLDVPDLQAALGVLRSYSDADVLDMEWSDVEAKSMGVSGGAIVLDPTGYCLRVCQAAR